MKTLKRGMFLHEIAGNLMKTSDHSSAAVTQKGKEPGNSRLDTCDKNDRVILRSPGLIVLRLFQTPHCS